MPRKPKGQIIQSQHFRWVLYQRDDIYYADGRSGNDVNVGRHSLEARTLDEAQEALRQLDLVKAVQFGKADAKVLNQSTDRLSLDDGWQNYKKFTERPAVAKGPGASTRKRYRAIMNKFMEFSGTRGVRYWDQVNKGLLLDYSGHLEDEGYEYATQYIELTTIKQIVKWLITENLLPTTCHIRLELSKAEGTTTYCYTPEEVVAMVHRCESEPSLHWLGHVIVGLACTGLRISELAGLRWSDLDEQLTRITLMDERRRGDRVHRATARTTKTHRDRSLPVHPDFRAVLQQIPRAKDGRIFHGPLGGVLKPDTVRVILCREVLTPLQKQFPAQADKKGIADGRLHSFRHYFCSVSANSKDVTEQMIKTWLGHRDSRMVKHYYHLHDDEAQRRMQQIKFVDRTPAASADGKSTGNQGDAEADRKTA